MIPGKHIHGRRLEKTQVEKEDKKILFKSYFSFSFLTDYLKSSYGRTTRTFKNKSTNKIIKCSFPKSSGNMASKLLLKRPMILPYFVQL